MAVFANGEPTELETNGDPISFSDTSSLWGNETIETMSAYCGVASPYQETGDSFQPDSPAARDYAAAATLRTHGCLTEE